MTVYPNVISVSPQFDSDHEIYLGTRRQGLLHSINGGASWVASSDVPNVHETLTTAISPNYANDHTALLGTGDGQIWRTISSGSQWARVGATTITIHSGQQVPWVAFSPNAAVDHLALAASNNGVYVSTDLGRHLDECE